MQNQISQFFNALAEAYLQNKPFVGYRKPNEEQVSLFIQNENKLHLLENYNQQGFIFVPFNNNGPSVLFPIEEVRILKTNINQFDVFLKNENSTRIKQVNDEDVLKKTHIALVEKGLQNIQLAKAHKIVLSRKETLQVSNFNVVHTFKKLLNTYTNAMVYVWYHPKVGLWLGATPERLLTIKNNSFKTMALAGTQVFNDALKVDWTTKEKKEQQYVTDYIVNSIKDKLFIKEITGPYTVKAGSLAHLRTDIIGEINQLNNLENLLKDLHPTPAVCGVPKSEALNFIIANENYTRTYYTGYLGELNIQNASELFVNLRCMQFIKNKSQLEIYVGGGITAQSNSEKEYEETVSKAQIMKRIL